MEGTDGAAKLVECAGEASCVVCCEGENPAVGTFLSSVAPSKTNAAHDFGISKLTSSQMVL